MLLRQHIPDSCQAPTVIDLSLEELFHPTIGSGAPLKIPCGPGVAHQRFGRRLLARLLRQIQHFLPFIEHFDVRADTPVLIGPHGIFRHVGVNRDGQCGQQSRVEIQLLAIPEKRLHLLVRSAPTRPQTEHVTFTQMPIARLNCSTLLEPTSALVGRTVQNVDVQQVERTQIRFGG